VFSLPTRIMTSRCQIHRAFTVLFHILSDIDVAFIQKLNKLHMKTCMLFTLGETENSSLVYDTRVGSALH